MHELSIAQAIVEAVGARAAECGATRVTSVRLRVGDAVGIVPDSLSFCFEMLAAEDPLLVGATLEIERVPHRARCRCCEREFAVADFVARCPACAALDVDVLSGAELEVRDMRVETVGL